MLLDNGEGRNYSPNIKDVMNEYEIPVNEKGKKRYISNYYHYLKCFRG